MNHWRFARAALPAGDRFPHHAVVYEREFMPGAIQRGRSAKARFSAEGVIWIPLLMPQESRCGRLKFRTRVNCDVRANGRMPIK